jgi:hypothetical protein
MQTTGATLIKVRRCSLARTWMLAQGSRSAYGLLYLAAVRGDCHSLRYSVIVRARTAVDPTASRPVTSVFVVAELPRQKDVLPVALAGKYVFVRRPHRPELKEGKPEIRAGIFATLVLDKFTEGEVSPV